MQTDLFQQGNEPKSKISKTELKKKVQKPSKVSKKTANSAHKVSDESYSAKDIEVLEGLEPVRRRPGMYIGGTDNRALHHLAAELLDNSMDEAVAGHASHIYIELHSDHSLSISDNGRGIPTDPHPKFKDKSALEVILTTLHSGGKFSGDAYETSGGLHGVGLSVVNALSDWFTVEVARQKNLWRQTYKRGAADSALEDCGVTNNRRGTKVTFHPDGEIFGSDNNFRPASLFRMAQSKAYLFRGVEIRWLCDESLLTSGEDTPRKATLHFPGGLSDYLMTVLSERKTITPDYFSGRSEMNGGSGRVEWAIGWPVDGEPTFKSYCNTVPTPLGGTHELGLRGALTKGLRAYGELVGNKQATKLNTDDVVGCACVMLSVFIEDPQFQGQTKEKLSSVEAQKLVEAALRDHFDHWLSGAPKVALGLLEYAIERSELRMKRRAQKETNRQSATRKLRLPGKLSDCTRTTSEGTELFIVEGDSAGGSAKQARNRLTQAVLPLRGKILNVASSTTDKMRANQELSDLIEALGCGLGDAFIEDDLRYDKIIIMTDADVDGAHIASLLMTFFFQEIQGLVDTGHLYLAMPPLYRITQGNKSVYARDDSHKEELCETAFTGRAKLEISRFKGLGEMPPGQLKETTMDPGKRILLRVTIPSGQTDDEILDARKTARLVDQLMGKKPEMRFKYIVENAKLVGDLDL